MKNWIILIIICNLRITSVNSQDIHWSQFTENPLYLNPSFSGYFKGDIRFIANYRDQWRSVTVPYSTFSLSSDFKVNHFNNFSVGVQLFHDVTGDGKFRTIDFKISPSYSLKLNRDSTKNIRFGIEFSANQRSIDFSKLYFDNQFSGIVFDPNLATNETFSNNKFSNLNSGVGVSYNQKMGKDKILNIGLTTNNLLKPNHSFFEANIIRELRTTFYSNLIIPYNIDFEIIPTLLFQTQGKYKELIIGSKVKYILENRLANYKAINTGLFFRNKDAVYLSAGIHFNKIYGGISYDFNISKLNIASNNRGGIEFVFQYIISTVKNSKKVYRICPDYI